MKEPGDDKKQGPPPLIEELSQKPRKPKRVIAKSSSRRGAQALPSLVDDVFAGRSSKAKGKSSKSEADPLSDRGPSLLDDVFAPEVRLSPRIPLWVIVAALVVIFGAGLTIYRFSTGPISSPLEGAVEAMARPPLAPIPEAAPEGPTPVHGATVQPPPQTPVDAGTTAPAPRTGRVSRETQETSPPTQRPPLSRPGAAERTGSAPPPRAAETQRDDKPKLLRGAEEPADVLEQKSFEVLREKSETARQLLLGNIDGIRMIEWNATSQDGSLFLIDIVAETQGVQAAHFVWAVDPQKQSVRAMSQAARDLEVTRSKNVR
jgi:hypothetical protein